jgi:DNA-binding beta-propeller fold protein YncE
MARTASLLVGCFMLCLAGACGGSLTSSRWSGGFASLPAGHMIVTVEDSDTPPQVYINGQILLREPGAVDTVTVLDLPLPAKTRGEQLASFSQLLVPTAMQSGASSLSINALGTRALVTARFGGASPEAVDVGQLPVSKAVTLIDLANSRGRVIESYALCAQPGAVSFDSSGTRAAVLGMAAHELVIVEILPERFGKSYRLPLEQLFGDGCEPTDVQWQPGTDLVAVTLGGAGRIVFFSVSDNLRDRFALDIVGGIKTGGYPSVARWLPGGEALVVADAQWESEFLNRYTPEGSGALIMIEPPDGANPAAILSTIPMTTAPSSIAVDSSGAFVAAVSMRKDEVGQRAGARGGTLSLFSLDTTHKELALLDIARTGSLPHDVAFDASGRGILVAGFGSGALEIFEVVQNEGGMGLSDTSMRVETNYGLYAVRVVR